jgi:hypothetical protein
MKEEKLSFLIALSGTYWDKRPEYSIWIDGECIEKKIITAESKELFEVAFSKTFTEGPHSLKIRLENKQNYDTVVLKDGTIDKDMLLNIENIVIDDIDIGNLKWTVSHYITDKPVYVDGESTNRLEACINLGWNGAYTINFTCPYYLWLLENL